MSRARSSRSARTLYSTTCAILAMVNVVRIVAPVCGLVRTGRSERLDIQRISPAQIRTGAHAHTSRATLEIAPPVARCALGIGLSRCHPERGERPPKLSGQV